MSKNSKMANFNALTSWLDWFKARPQYKKSHRAKLIELKDSEG